MGWKKYLPSLNNFQIISHSLSLLFHILALILLLEMAIKIGNSHYDHKDENSVNLYISLASELKDQIELECIDRRKGQDSLDFLFDQLLILRFKNVIFQFSLSFSFNFLSFPILLVVFIFILSFPILLLHPCHFQFIDHFNNFSF